MLSNEWRADVVPFDGHPFVIIGRQHLQCRFGPLRHEVKVTLGTSVLHISNCITLAFT